MVKASFTVISSLPAIDRFMVKPIARRQNSNTPPLSRKGVRCYAHDVRWQRATARKVQAEMTDPIVLDIGQGLDAHVFSAHAPGKVQILAFHGGGGVDGSPDMMAPFATSVTKDPGVSMAVVQYRTLKRDQAKFEDMRADAARALSWATDRLRKNQSLYLLGASFGGLLALDALLEADQGVQDKVAGLILLNAVTDTGADGWSNRVITPEQHGALSPLARLTDHPLLSRLRCFLAHGGQDDVVPIDTSRRFAALWAKDRCEMREFPNADHGFFNREPNGATVAQAIRKFVKADGKRKAPSGLLPKGATVVYGVGAQKAGTSWLFDCLSQSPECHTGPTKEHHYFDVLYVKSEATHFEQRQNQLRKIVQGLKPGADPRNRKRLANIQILAERLSIHAAAPGDHRPYVDYLCKGYQGEKIVCDFTPSYCTLDAAGFREMNSIGPAKFIFVLRDPVDRLWSQVRMSVSTSDPKLSDAEYEAKCLAHIQNLHAKRDLARIPRADYARTMTALEAAVPAENIHYTFYETLFSQDSVDAICDFVGIKPIVVAPAKRVNLGRSTSLPPDVAEMMARALAPQYDAVRVKFGEAVPEHWRADIPQADTGPIGSMSGKVVRIGNRLRGKLS